MHAIIDIARDALGLRLRGVRRWTSAELAIEKAYLEGFESRPKDMAKADHLRLAIYLVQRHYPAERKISREEWARFIDRTSAEIEKYYGKHVPQILASNISQTNAEISARRDILLNSYSLTMEDFDREIIPILFSFDILDISEVNEIRSEMFDANSLKSSSSAATASALLGTLYEQMRRAQNAGYKKCRLVTRRCACLQEYDREPFNISNLQDSFESCGKLGVVAAIMTSDCLNNESPRLCGAHVLACAESAIPSDPKFEAFLERLSQKSS